MHNSLLEILIPDDMLAQRTLARYFYFQAMGCYENAMLAQGTERITWMKKSEALIARSLMIKPDSPTAFFLAVTDKSVAESRLRSKGAHGAIV
jgi:hypothetical protein